MNIVQALRAELLLNSELAQYAPYFMHYLPLLPLREQRCGRRRVDNRPLSYLL
jgi:hypothetical protein